MLNIFAIWLSQPGPTLISAAIGFLLGAFVNHKWAAKRDRDKDFNALADTIRQQIRQELDDMRANAQFVDSASIDLLSDIAGPIKRRRLCAALSAYKEARQQYKTQDPNFGESSYTQTEHIEKALKQLLALTGRQ